MFTIQNNNGLNTEDRNYLNYATSPSVSIINQNIDWGLSSTFYKTLFSGETFTFSNVVESKSIMVAITNSNSGWLVTWPSISWQGGVTPIQTSGNKTDIYSFIKIGTGIYGAVVQNY